MRLLGLAIVFTILVLVAQPCRELVTSAKANVPTVSVRTSTSFPVPSDDQKQDDCSPFCVCSCCGISAIYQATLIDVAAPQIFERDFMSPSFDYTEPFSSLHKNPVWQPPKA